MKFAYASPFYRISWSKIPKKLTTLHNHHQLPIHHRITYSTQRPLRTTVRRLSYTSTPKIEVPASPDFPLMPCTVTSASEAIVCRNRTPLSQAPGGLDSHQTFTTTRTMQTFPSARRFVVAQSYVTRNRNESKGGISPPSAQFSRTNLITSMRLNRASTTWRVILWCIRTSVI